MPQLKPWSAIVASPQYQQADDATKQKMQSQYTQAGGTIEQAPTAPAEQPSSGLAEDIGNTLVAGAKGAAASVGHGIVSGLTGITKATDTVANRIMGNQAPSIISTYAKRVQDANEKLYQQKMQDASAGGHETAANVGAQVGQTAADIGTMVVAPGAAIPAIAAREFGRAYNESGDLAGATAVGAANFLAGRILPGAGSEAAEGLINRGIAAAQNIGRNALAGAEGGAIVGGAEAANKKDTTAGKIIGGAIEGGGTGAAFGGAFGAAHEAVGAITNKTARAVEDVVQNDVPPEAAPDIDAQATTVTNAQTPAQKADALKNAGQYRAVKGSAALEARGIPLLDSRLGYSPDAMAAHGKSLEDVQASRDVAREGQTNAMLPFGLTPSEAAGKMAVAKSQIEKGGRQLVDDVKGSLESGEKSISNFKNDVQEDFASRAGSATTAEKQANTEQMAQINRFQKDYSNWKSSMTNLSSGESVRSENVLDLAAKAQESFDAMPDYFKEQFQADHKDMGEGFAKGFNPVDNSGTYIDAFNQLKEMHPSFRNATTAPSQGAVKGTPQPSVLGMAKASLDAFGAGRARSKMVAEQSANASQVRQLASGLANAERRSRVNVEDAKAGAMNDTPPDDGTASQMEYSGPAAEPAPAPQPDQGIVRTPRQPVRPEEPAPVEPEPTPEPEAPAPNPDQVAVRNPRRPEAPVEETPAPVEEPQAQPDQTLARTPKQPVREEAPVEEPAPEAPVEPVETPEPTPERLPASAPKAREKAPEAAPVEEKPLTEVKPEEATTLGKHLKAVAERQLGIVKKMFTSKKIQDKVNVENMNNKSVLDTLKRQDVTENAQALHEAGKELAKQKGIREEGAHKANVARLEDWSKKSGIAWKYIDEALKQKGLQKSNILGIGDIQVRATKAWQRDLDQAALDAQPKEEKITKEIEPWTAQRDKFYEEVTKMHPDVRAKAMQLIDNAFKASAKTEKSLTDSDVHGLWNKIYNHEADVHTKAAREAEAAQAKAKKERLDAELAQDAETKAMHEERTAKQKAEESKRADTQKLAYQREDLINKINSKLKGKVSDAELDQLADTYWDDNAGALETPMSDVRFNALRSRAVEWAEKQATKLEKASAAEKEEILGGKETEVTKAAKKIEQEVEDAIGKSTVDKEEVENHLAEELIDRSESAFREGEDVSKVNEAANALMKAYKMDPTTGYSLRQYPRVIAKAANYRSEFPNNPEVWLSQTDVDSLAKAGRVNADGMKAKITDTVIGKRYDSVKLLTDRERQAVVEKLRAGEKLNVKIDKGRRGALQQVEEQKPKVTVKKPVKAPATPEQQALKNQKAKVARMQKKLNDDRYWALNDDEYGRKWKAYQSDVNIEKRKLQDMIKKG